MGIIDDLVDKGLTDAYNTHLDTADEILFQVWATSHGRRHDAYDYDIRGAWKAIVGGTMSMDARGHLGDMFKKPNHPTFSNQSVYHGVDGFEGGVWGQDAQGGDTFTPSKTNLENMSPSALRRYFDMVEPNVRLILPKE